jgi:hypothetical protein
MSCEILHVDGTRLVHEIIDIIANLLGWCKTKGKADT